MMLTVNNFIMKNKKLLLLIHVKVILLACLITQAGFASTFYEPATSGSENNGGSSSSPFKIIVRAASVSNANDVVLISVGTHSEFNITPSSSGAEGDHVVFKPNPGSGTLIVKHPGSDSDDSIPVFNLSKRNFIWIEGILF